VRILLVGAMVQPGLRFLVVTIQPASSDQDLRETYLYITAGIGLSEYLDETRLGFVMIREGAIFELDRAC
jgi:hypothetical protein